MLAALAVVILAVVGLQSWTVPYYALTPGQASAVGPLVSVSGLPSRDHHDRILLTDVYLSSLTAWQWLVLHFQHPVEFVSANQLLEPGIPSDEIGPQGFLQMSDSKEAAAVAALRALGWRPVATPTGAVVTGVIAPSPARHHLHVADRIVAVDGRSVRSACGLVAAVHDLRPGSTVRLGVDPARIDAQGRITYGTERTVSLRAGTPPAGSLPSGCPGVSGPDHAWLGVALEDGVAFRLPATVNVDTNYIGGPSAGLAMTLALIDQLSRTSITGGHVVAATGTIDTAGQVGDVGGVAEKTIAVERAGATVFLVPQVEVATARSVASPSLRVIGVTSLRQALDALHRLGGARPVPLSAPHPLGSTGTGTRSS